MTAILDHLWQSMLCCALITGCASCVRGSRAVVRLWLWRGALLKFLAPLSLLHRLGGWLGFPVAHTADLPPAWLFSARDTAAPFFMVAGDAHVAGLASGWLSALLVCGSALTVYLAVMRAGVERRRACEEQRRRERDVDDVLPYPGFTVTAFMSLCAGAIIASPVLAGALSDRQHRQELLIVNSLSLRQGRITLTQAAPGSGLRYRVLADDHGALIANASLIDLVSIVYGIHRSAVWTEQHGTGERSDFWLNSPRYDVRVEAPVEQPRDFDPYALRQPVTRLLAMRFGLQINLNDRCQPPCGNYGVAMPEEPL